ncbi:recombinase family protein [uncultured Methylobacterium sp.]|uniref:recombinase family protein n=1 Tax=uncultured Methylobacterium sp. TaxID=157278 RepID=UPI0035C9AC70
MKAVLSTKAVAYLRVSTDEQASNGFGLETQERALRAFAESQSYDLVEIITDGGVSGATRPAERPGFAKVLELAELKAFSILLVYKFDRLAREIRYAVTTVADLAEQHDIGIRSVTEPIDTATPMGRTVFAILAGMAESERFTIRDRTAGGKLSKAGRGGFAGGRAPFGYETDLEGGLRIIPEEAAIVRRIFKERGPAARPKRTLRDIAAGLNADGIRSPTGKAWRHDGVGYVLDNPKYRGLVEYLFTWTGTEQHVLQPGTHAAII